MNNFLFWQGVIYTLICVLTGAVVAWLWYLARLDETEPPKHFDLPAQDPPSGIPDYVPDEWVSR